MREALYLNGLRLLVDSSGIGRKASMVLAVIQLGSAIALIRVAAIVADNIMLYSLQYTKTRREAYYKCKVQETKDYSDLQDRINLIQETKGRDVSGARPKGGASAGDKRLLRFARPHQSNPRDERPRCERGPPKGRCKCRRQKITPICKTASI